MRYTEEECAAWLGIASEANRHAKAIKAQLRDDLLAMGDKGVDSLALRANGVKVGKVQRIDGKAEVAMLEPEDDCIEWLAGKGMTKAVIVPLEGWRDCLAIVDDRVVDKDTGEDVSALFTISYKPATTRVTGCKYKDVAEAFGGYAQLSAGLAPQLEGGN